MAAVVITLRFLLSNLATDYTDFIHGFFLIIIRKWEWYDDKALATLTGRAGDSEDETFAAVRVCFGAGADAADLFYGAL